jgi:hypothetical protein
MNAGSRDGMYRGALNSASPTSVPSFNTKPRAVCVKYVNSNFTVYTQNTLMKLRQRSRYLSYGFDYPGVGDRLLEGK